MFHLLQLLKTEILSEVRLGLKTNLLNISKTLSFIFIEDVSINYYKPPKLEKCMKEFPAINQACKTNYSFIVVL